ncbi:hypothetical protein [Lyngbya aestuarii]|uniref:hypothetical protein n=1 Tax=Lyngbya aestuarii TaxID=118322 RepID=UPI00403D9B3C
MADSFADLLKASNNMINSGPIRVEAEQMTLNNYRIESADSASGGQLIGLLETPSNTGTASTVFTGASGSYDIIIGYYDENDGKASLELLSDGVSIDNWTLNKNLDSSGPSSKSFTKHTIDGQSLTQGETIAIQGTVNKEEYARVDYIEFVPVLGDSSQPLSEVDPVVDFEFSSPFTMGAQTPTSSSSSSPVQDIIPSFNLFDPGGGLISGSIPFVGLPGSSDSFGSLGSLLPF